MLVRHEPKCKTHEPKARNVSGYDGMERDSAKRRVGRISQADLSRDHKIGGKTFRRRSGIIGIEAESGKNV